MDEKNMQRPGWNNNINPNTILQVLTLISVFTGIGVVWQEQRAGVQRNAENIERQQRVIDSIVSSLTTYSNLPYRLTTLEARVGATEAAIKDGDRAVTQLASDIRVMREILERLDPQRQR